MSTEQMREAGAMLSNIAFNLAQRKPGELSARDIESLDKARKAWDAALSQPAAPAQSLAELLRDMVPAARDVLLERNRQVNEEGYTQQHDDNHINEEIAAMACFYAMPAGAREWSADDSGYGGTLGEAILPEGWAAKECDRRAELVKSAALILAEIERLDRADVLAAIDKMGGKV